MFSGGSGFPVAKQARDGRSEERGQLARSVRGRGRASVIRATRVLALPLQQGTQQSLTPTTASPARNTTIIKTVGTFRTRTGQSERHTSYPSPGSASPARNTTIIKTVGTFRTRTGQSERHTSYQSPGSASPARNTAIIDTYHCLSSKEHNTH